MQNETGPELNAEEMQQLEEVVDAARTINRSGGHMTMDELLHLQEAMNNFEDEVVDESDVWYVSDSDVENEEETYNTINETFVTTNKKPNLPNNRRKNLVVDMFHVASDEYVLPRGTVTKMANKYGISRFTVNRIWNHAKSQKQKGEEVDVSIQKYKCGRKPFLTDEEVIRRVPLKLRTTIRSFAAALEVSPSTIHRLLRRGILRSHTNSIKPKLKIPHKIARMKFVLSQIIPRTVTEMSRFDKLYNVIHIDEKWFFMSKITQRFYLLSEEQDPYRACQSKNFITKVMFLAAIARPIFGELGELLWDGKIGIFPFIEYVTAQRTSKNRDRGTIETKALQSITKETIRHMIVHVLLPAIREKWPSFATKTIWIQQDNARPHIQPNDQEFLNEAQKDGFDIRLICQPAQSPDLNIFDLGFFRAIQSIQHQKFPQTVDELVDSVTEAYNCYDPKIINYTWVHLMYVMIEVLKCKGGNNYKNPHKGKKKMDNLGILPTFVEVPQTLITETVQILDEGIVCGPSTEVPNASDTEAEVPNASGIVCGPSTVQITEAADMIEG